MSAQHTPGPWFAESPSEVTYKWLSSSEGAHGDLATVWNSHQNAEANARLIAAAPDLLQEIRTLCAAASTLNSGKVHAIELNNEIVYWQREEWIRWMLDEILPNARAAIAKATGGVA